MLSNFIKTVWVASIMRALEKAQVFASTANTEYQGQLNNLGDKVKIMMLGKVAITSYSKDTDISSPEDLQDAAAELVADQAHYFNFKANDVEAVQNKASLLAEATQGAAYGFRDVVDRYFSGLFATAGFQSYATGTTPWEVNSLNAEDVLLEASEIFGTNNIPKEGRFMIIPEWFHTKLVLAGLATKTANDALFENGMLGNVLGWNLKLSNNISEASSKTDVKIMAGIDKKSYSFANVISSIEAYRPEKRFEDAVKGLYVFGGKIIRPDMTLCIHATRKAEA